MRASSWLVLLGSGCLVSCGEKDASRPAPLVATVTAAPAASARADALTGEVRARYDSTLSFRVGGQIIDRPVRLGQMVRRGQVLAQLDASDLALGATEAAAQASAAERQVAAARAAAARAASDERRLRPLVGAGGIAPQQYDAARATAEASSADLAAAEARLTATRAAARSAGNQRRYASLVADADGVVAELLAEPGQVVAVGQPVVRVARSGGRDAVVAVPEDRRGQLPARAVASVYGGGRYDATLRELSAAADPRTRTYEARYMLAGAPAALPVGSTVTLNLGGDATAGVGRLALPLGALLDRGRGFSVWTVRPDSTVTLRRVRVASVDGETAVIQGGLRAGERVVALGAHLLAEGQKVRVGGMPR
ncbi:MAG: efflux RND transporter periplasmic adaptor subunit [Sphingobium sp.]|nr:MAG: efflux RND transporter periplasmic adaptor subunit [Sphingobium sp.]